MKKYTFNKIKELVDSLGLKKSGIKGIILEPQSEEKYFELKIITGKIPSKVPIKVKCGIPEHPNWITTADRLQQGHWCRYCAFEIYTYDKVYNLIKEVGLEKTGIEGILISPESPEEFNELTNSYQPSYIPLLVSCRTPNHPNWITSGRALARGNWCRECYIESMKLKYNEIKKIVENVGLSKTGRKGILINPNNEKEFIELTREENPSKIPLKVRCGINSHPEWITDATHLVRGNWCKFCVFGIYTYDSVINLVSEMGLNKSGIEGIILKPSNGNEFKELTNNFKSSEVPIRVKCGILNHGSWKTNAHRLQQGNWCPICSQGEYEQICRWYFEQIFGVKFPKTRLDNIIKLYKKNAYTEIELEAINNLIKYGHFDGYAELYIMDKWLKLAFEYNGPQHYRFPNHVHDTKEKFKYQQLLDRLKKELCEINENNIILIIFPYYIDERMDNPKNIQKHIIKEFKVKFGIDLSCLPKFNHKTYIFGQYRLDRYLK